MYINIHACVLIFLFFCSAMVISAFYMGDIMKSDNKERKIYLAILLVFIIAFVGITALYLVRKSNTSIVIQGEPEDIVLENFSGDLDFEVYTVHAYDGSVTNRDAVSFTIDGKTYTAEPGELVIEFEKEYSEEVNAYVPGSISNQHMSLTSDSSLDEGSFADTVEIRYAGRITESDSEELDGSYNEDDTEDVIVNDNVKKRLVTTKTMEVSIKNFSSLGSFLIGSEDALNASYNTCVKFKNEVLSDSGADIFLKDYCHFSFVDVSELELFLSDESMDFYLNGQISKLSGTLGNDDAVLYRTSGAYQASFFCGNQKLSAQGGTLNAEYEYNSDSAGLVVNGKPKTAMLEGIDVLEGFVQYLVTNFDSIFFAFAGALLALAIDKTLKKE